MPVALEITTDSSASRTNIALRSASVHSAIVVRSHPSRRSSETAWIRRTAGSPLLTMAMRENVTAIPLRSESCTPPSPVTRTVVDSRSGHWHERGCDARQGDPRRQGQRRRHDLARDAGQRRGKGHGRPLHRGGGRVPGRQCRRRPRPGERDRPHGGAPGELARRDPGVGRHGQEHADLRADRRHPHGDGAHDPQPEPPRARRRRRSTVRAAERRRPREVPPRRDGARVADPARGLPGPRSEGAARRCGSG